MYTIRTLNNIAKTGLAKLPEQNFVIDEKAENPEGIILRSFDRTVCILQTHHCRGSLGTGAEGQLRKRGKGSRGRQEGIHRP